MSIKNFLRFKPQKPWILRLGANELDLFFPLGRKMKSKSFVKIQGKRYWVSHYFMIGQSVAWHFTNGKTTFSYDLKKL